ncbi:SH3 domain-containing protein [Psychrobacillus antarcticus]|uniref:SH3 domain-containing protein n=1 Tax=Psychrobacillus antarcticus TaxID=2879115 RepID=UPI002408673C|nr:SH3 domain-containing protein [Psychrobacillus antarcticus]
MKKIIASSVLATSVLLPLNLVANEAPSVYAASNSAIVLGDIQQLVGNKALLTENNVNIRSGAGTEFDKVIQVNTGQSVSVLAFAKNSKGEVWYKVSLSSTEGWIISDYLTAATNAVKASTSKSGDAYVGTSQKIGERASEMRKGATASYDVVATIPEGTALKIISAFTNAQNEIWFNVENNGKKGWVTSDLFILNDNAAETAAKAVKASTLKSGDSYVGTSQNIGKNASNMRSGATTSYKLIASIPAGTSLKIIGAFTNAQNEIWFNVEYKGKKGWVTSDLFVLNGTAGETATMMKVINSSTVHSGATKNYSTVFTAKAGATMTVHQEFTNGYNEKWVQVTYATGKKGWILASAFEDSSIANKVVSKNSTVHSGATKSYKTVATINKGVKLAIHQEFTNGSKEKWYQVTYAVGKKGWIAADAFDSVSTVPENPPTETPTPNVEVITEENHLSVSVSVANMRSGPATTFDVVTQSRLNDQFVSAQYVTDASNEKWYKVVSGSGDAWLHQSVVTIVDKVNETPVVTPGNGETGTIQRFNALLYANSNYNSSVLVGLPRSTKFTVLSKIVSTDGTTWINIQANGKQGWIPDFEINENIPTKYGTKTSTVYSGASATAKKVDTIYLSSPVRVLRSLNGWLNIETPNEKRGWIQASVLSDAASISPISPISLTNGRTEVRKGQNYMVWSKPSKFDITYSIPSANVLRVFGNLSSINEIKSNVAGVKSMKVEKVSGGTSVLLVTFDPNYTYTIRDYNNELTIKVVPKGLAGKKIIIDAGHGASDPGAIGKKGTKEKDVNLATANFLKAELEAAGATVTLTRSTDVFLELSQRTGISNASDYDAFISIHADSFSSTSKGTTTFYNSSVSFNGPRSLTLAKSIQSDLVKAIGTYNRGIKPQNFYVNRMNELPSVLVELAFLSNPTEEAQLASTSFRKNAAIGIRKGLENYFNQ